MHKYSLSVKSVSIFVMVTLLLGLVWFPQSVNGANSKVGEALQDVLGQGYAQSVSVIVQGQSLDALTALIAAQSGRVTQELPVIYSVVAELSPKAIQEVARHPAVERVWLDQSVTQADAPPEAGTVLWTATTNKYVDRTPAVAPGGTLVVADRTRTVYAFGMDGALLWSFETVGRLDAGPAVGPDGNIYIGDKGGTLYALNPTGQLDWQYDTGKAIKTTAAVADDGTIYFATKKELYALDSAGNLLGSHQAHKRIIAAPALSPDGSVVYFGDIGGNFYAYSLTDGLLWENNNGNVAYNHAPVVGDDGTIYAVAKKLAGAAAPAGNLIWGFQAAARIGGSLALGPEGNVYFGDYAGTFYALDSNGDLIQSVQGDDPIKTGAAVAADGTVFAAAKKTLYAGNPDGSVLFEFQAAGRIKAAPVLNADGSVVFITDHKKNLYAIAADAAPAPDTAYPRVVGAQEVWAQGISGDGVGVAVVDTGIALLEGLVFNADGDIRVAGWADFVDSSPLPVDPNGHGTHVAGIIANSATTELGHYAGVAPNLNLIGVRVLDETGTGTYGSTIAGIGWVIANKDVHNIRVMNLSLVAPVQSHYWDDPLNKAVMAAWASGITVVVAAGNGGPAPMSIQVPGNVPYVITVGAFTDNYTPCDFSDDYLAPFSSAGPTWDGFIKPDVIAPGAHMVSLMAADSYLAQAYPDKQVAENYYQMAGTSAAAPVVSAISALVLDADPTLNPDQVKYRVLSSANPAVQDSDGDGDLDSLAYSPWQQGAGRVWTPDAVLSTLTEAANSNMDIWLDLAGEKHYIGPTRYHKETETFYVEGNGEYIWDGGEYIWNGGEYIWDGGEFIWGGGEYIWDGGEYKWQGG